MNVIKGTEVLKDIETEAPLDIKRSHEAFESGFQAPFDATKCNQALETTGYYQAGANFFSVSLYETAMKGVPYRMSAVQHLKDFYFGSDEPGFFPGIIWAAVDNKAVDVKANLGKFPEISPEELRHASILACAEQIGTGADDERLRLWRRFFLTATVRFVVIPADQSRYFKAVSLRNALHVP